MVVHQIKYLNMLSLKKRTLILFTVFSALSCTYSKKVINFSDNETFICTFINDLKTPNSPNTMYVNQVLCASRNEYILARYLKDSKIPFKEKDISLLNTNIVHTENCKLENGIVFVDSITLDSIKQKDAEIRYENVPIDSIIYYKGKVTPYYPIEIGQPAFYGEFSVISYHHYTSTTYVLYKRSKSNWEKVKYLIDPY